MAEYEITEDAYVRANTYAFRRMRLILSSVALLVPVLALPVLGIDRTTVTAVAIVYVLIVPFLFIAAPMINRWNYRRVYRNNPLLHGRQQVELGDDAIELSSDNGAVRYALTELKKIRIHPDMVLIYPMTTMYHMIPREVLSDSDISLLQRHAQERP